MYFDDVGSMGSWYSPVFYPSVSQPVYFFPSPPGLMETGPTDAHVPRSEAVKEENAKGPSIEIVLDQPVIDCP